MTDLVNKLQESNFNIIVDTRDWFKILFWLSFSNIYTIYMEIVLFPVGNSNNRLPVSHLILYSSFQCVEEVLGYLKSCFSREPMMVTVCVQQVSVISCPLGFGLTLPGEATKLSSVLEAGAYCVILGRVGCHSCLLCDWDCEGAEGIKSSTGPHCFACVCYPIPVDLYLKYSFYLEL